jgi:hypothetical protein
MQAAGLLCNHLAPSGTSGRGPHSHLALASPPLSAGDGPQFAEGVDMFRLLETTGRHRGDRRCAPQILAPRRSIEGRRLRRGFHAPALHRELTTVPCSLSRARHARRRPHTCARPSLPVGPLMGHRPPHLVPDDPCSTGPTASLVAALDSPLRVGGNHTVCHGGCCMSWGRMRRDVRRRPGAHVGSRIPVDSGVGRATTTAWAPCEEADSLHGAG